jgi:hypothetical protein
MRLRSVCHLSLFVFLAVLSSLPRIVSAQTPFNNINIGFQEYPFPTGTTTMTGTTNYNLINDSTGLELTSNNADQNDFSISFTDSGSVPLASPNTPRVRWNNTAGNGRFTSEHGYTAPVSSNNPGTRMTTTVTLLFNSNLQVTNFSTLFTSLNSGGISWETSVLGFLKPDGTAFTPQPVIADYLSSGAGLFASPSQGWFVANLTSTVNSASVGTNTVGAGSDSPNENGFTFDYAKAGLAPGTPIGGVVWITHLDDVRGTSNVQTNLTSSWTEFTFSGTVAAIPEPGTLALLFAPAALGFLRRRR